MSNPEQKLIDAGFPLEDAPAPSGLYKPLILEGNIAYLSGMIPLEKGKVKYSGTVPDPISVEIAQEAAKLCIANLLRVIYRDLGGLGKIQQVIKITGFIASNPGFTDQHIVMNAASQFLTDLLGVMGEHARSAVGVAALPLNSPVEIEAIIKLKR